MYVEKNSFVDDIILYLYEHNTYQCSLLFQIFIVLFVVPVSTYNKMVKNV